jgi:hypothetical protein
MFLDGWVGGWMDGWMDGSKSRLRIAYSNQKLNVVHGWFIGG